MEKQRVDDRKPEGGLEKENCKKIISEKKKKDREQKEERERRNVGVEMMKSISTPNKCFLIFILVKDFCLFVCFNSSKSYILKQLLFSV